MTVPRASGDEPEKRKWLSSVLSSIGRIRVNPVVRACSLLHTCDEYGRVDEYCPLYADRKDAEEAAECLDIGQEGDPYSIIRYRVIELTVK